MTCPTITTLHAILAAYDAPAGPSKADTIKAVAECLSGACAPDAPDLHDAIMRLPCDSNLAHGDPETAYKYGHRDARHAAAELAIAQPVAAQGGQDAGWISVDDVKKPVGRTPILVAVSFVRYGEHDDGSPGEYHGVDVTEGEYVPGHGERECYFESFQGTHGDASHVTHWMPLPAAPAILAAKGGAA
ncbi:MAG: DUF551 domain-containing protein [Telluria sp.]